MAEDNSAVPEESLTLQSLLGSESCVSEFLERIWQTSCFVYSRRSFEAVSQEEDATFKGDAVRQDPHGELIRHGWMVLIQLLEQTRRESEATNNEEPSSAGEALLFRNLELLPPGDCALYDHSLFAAFLDGCSVVINHADSLSPWIAALCQDLQRSFPHAYANTYLTPAASQAVPPHADDRDVFVFQIVGSKQWKVYQSIPIPYPYPHEQVGKAGLDVPQAVLQGLFLEQTLQPGQVLYLPRGYVHEARATDQASFHVTIALATHDWSLAGLVSTATQTLLVRDINNRKAVSRELGTRDWTKVSERVKQDMERQLEQTFTMLREQVTVETLHENLQRKYERHNRRADKIRSRRIQQAIMNPAKSTSLQVVGREASETVVLSTTIRVASPQEKASLAPTLKPLGLHVRPETYEGIMSILQRLKGDTALRCRVADLKSLLTENKPQMELICDLTLLCFARQCVELGALAIAP